MKQTISNLPKSPVKVVLVEDKPAVRDSWIKLIDSLPGFSCVQACTSGEDALRVIPPLNPDVVLMDIFLPRMSGIECTARLKLQLPKIQILILTAVEDDELVFMALEVGTVGDVVKAAPPQDHPGGCLTLCVGAAVSHAANLTWDANTAVTGAQDGSGTWDATTAGWWTGSADAVFSSVTPDVPTIGNLNGTAGTITLGANVVAD